MSDIKDIKDKNVGAISIMASRINSLLPEDTKYGIQETGKSLDAIEKEEKRQELEAKARIIGESRAKTIEDGGAGIVEQIDKVMKDEKEMAELDM